MKGGGVKGIAYVGALQVLEEYGYHFDHFVGTSAGAISAALLAVGYSPKELGEILAKTDFREFKDGWLPLSLPLLPFRKGLYRGETFRIWLENYLRADVRTHLPKRSARRRVRQ
jgi:NTE family protein